jgi:hypothetical protein
MEMTECITSTPQEPSGCPSVNSKPMKKEIQKISDSRERERKKISDPSRERERETSIDNGVVKVAYLAITFPSLPTRNLVKFHLILDPKNPGLLAFRNL